MSVALVGEWANATTQMLGGYSGVAPFLHSPLYALQQLPGLTVNFVAEINDPAPAFEAARRSDVVIYVGGIDESVEREQLDRVSLTWNSTQTSLIISLASVGKPLIIVQTGAGQLDDSAFLANDNISAILWVGYPGQDGGPAITDVIFGKVAPAGRLPVTQYPAKYAEDIPMTDMALRPHIGSPGPTYKWYTGAPVLPFGYGLHYTSFETKAWIEGLHGNRSVNAASFLQRCPPDKPLDTCIVGYVSVAVHNTGQIKSDYVILAFLSGRYGPAPHPKKQLVAYQRMHDIEPGKIKHARLPMTLGGLARWDEKPRRILYPGEYKIVIDIGEGCDEAWFEITGREQVLETWPEYI